MAKLPEYALAIRQPWAWAIAHAGKDIENRNWNTRFRGPVCIHASKEMPLGEYMDATHDIRSLTGKSCPRLNQLPRGCIFATANIVDVVTEHSSPWFFGKFGFVLEDVEPVDFIRVKGRLGFFKWEASNDIANRKIGAVK